MPKLAQYPRLRTHTRKGKGGQIWTSYYWDGRGKKTKDIPLGNDFPTALASWMQIEQGIYRPSVKKVRLSQRVPGKRRRFIENYWDDLPAWGKRMYLNAETRAASLGRPFVLTVNQLTAVIRRADGHCELSGIKFDDSGERHPFSPSVDRIDSSIGYQEGNIRIVCLMANFAMNTWGDEHLFVLAEALFRKRLADVGGNGRECQCALSTQRNETDGASGRARTVMTEVTGF